MALFITKAINRHRKELHAVLKIIIDMSSSSPVYIEASGSDSREWEQGEGARPTPTALFQIRGER
jgi:hypothetical protein